MDAKRGFRPSLVVGKWKLGKLINKGGQGEVWEVRSTSSNHSPPRAMKICTATEDQARRRFEREVELLVRMTHTNVVPVLDSDLNWAAHEKAVVQFGYYVSERFECSLADLAWIHEAPVLALKLFRGVCSAIDYLHQCTPPVVHRDLKPTNVLYGSEPRRVAVADLGIAHLATEGPPLTKTNEVVGTQYYRAPETFLGSTGDERSDIYSLGRTLEWVLTGRTPDQEVPRAVPETSGLSAAAREVVDSVLRTACALNPADRYNSVAELSAAIPGMVADIATRTPRPDTPLLPLDSPSQSYHQAKELLRARDVVAWRDLRKHQRAQLLRRSPKVTRPC